MQIDRYGQKRQKVNLHMHTTRSDGGFSPDTALRVYRNEGYDAVALTDHWRYGAAGEAYGMTVLSGVEYNIDGSTGEGHYFHILGIGAEQEPQIVGDSKTAEPQQVIDAIHAAGGIAILAHPAWSLNTPEHIMRLNGFDATEIYNTVSGVHESRRADSSLIVDMLGARGFYLPLVADDDTHYYDSDRCVAWIMVRAENASREALLPAIRRGDFYATQGPEVHLHIEGNEAVVTCSPCREIALFSNTVWLNHSKLIGDGLTEARIRLTDQDRFARVQVTDKDGKCAWTNCVPLQRNEE